MSKKPAKAKAKAKAKAVKIATEFTRAADDPRVVHIAELLSDIFRDRGISREQCIEMLEEIGADVDAKLDEMRDDVTD